MTDLTPERALELVEKNITWNHRDDAGTLRRAEDVFAVLRSTIAEVSEMKSRVAYAAAIVSGDASWDKQEELERVTAERNNLRRAWDEMEPEYGVYVLGTETPVDPNTEENARETAARLSRTEPSTFPHEPVRRYSTNWDYI